MSSDVIVFTHISANAAVRLPLRAGREHSLCRWPRPSSRSPSAVPDMQPDTPSVRLTPAPGMFPLPAALHRARQANSRRNGIQQINNFA